MLHEESMMPYIYSTFISDISRHTQHNIYIYQNHAICITKIILLPIVFNNHYYAKVKL